MSDPLRSGGVSGLLEWRREAERRNEPWKSELIEAFGDVFPELVVQMREQVWGPQMVEVFKARYKLGDLSRYGSGFELSAVFKDGVVTLGLFRDGVMVHHLYKVSESLAGGFLRCDFESFAHQVQSHRLATLYFCLAFPDVTAAGLGILGNVFASGGLWRLQGVSVSPGIRANLEMPLSYKDDADKAIMWLRNEGPRLRWRVFAEETRG